MTPGPPPKDRSARRRHNAPAGGEWIDLPPVDENVKLALPNRSGEGWSARARATWEAWSRDPATTQWSPADVSYAIDTLYLVDLYARRLTRSLAGEIRLRMDGLGLTAKGRRNLRWRIADPAEVVEHAAGASKCSKAGRRRLMRAVDLEAK